ncbi:MAG: SUF system Fe-S cluster assembly protein [Chloroflexota bacterium]
MDLFRRAFGDREREASIEETSAPAQSESQAAAPAGGTPTEEAILEALKEIYDPEIGINIVDLGLIYGLDITPEGKVKVTMTLTTPACPIGPIIRSQVREVLTRRVPGVKETEVNLVWSPPWTPAMMSEDAKAELGLGF